MDKDKLERYIEENIKKLVDIGIYVSDDKKNSIINRYIDSDMDIRDIISEIDDMTEEYIETYKRIMELRESYLEKIKMHKELEELPLEYSGITLNKQDIDLMNIVSANTPLELLDALDSNLSLEDIDNTSDKDFVKYKDKIFRMYQDSLTDKNDYINNPNISIQRKIKYLKDSGVLTEEEKDKLDRILETSTRDNIIDNINNQFGEERAHTIYEIVSNYSPIEKSGIKSTTYEASKQLLENIKNDYNSITIDYEAKYGGVALEDGTFNFEKLDKVLEFAKKLDKKVRLNALIFYMDCPDELYKLDVNEENKVLVKERLISYVDNLTKHIIDCGYEDTVRSIDAFNELLNRSPLKGDTPYKNRGDIEQDPNDDNTKSGWLKFLDIEDLCDVISVARRNMPNTDFMYNDDNLEDERKITANEDIINKIQEYEKKNNIKLIDSIGTQMHIDNNVSIYSISNMLKRLSKYNLPIEITEFDMAMTHDIDGLSDKEIEIMRQGKISEIFTIINNLKDECRIRGCTIWSKTDSQNFRVTLENERRINNGEEPIKTLHGGYYTESMESKSKQLIREEKYQEYNYHTHTKRCGHAGTSSDIDYINACRTVGMKTIGFSDHIPFTDIEYPNKKQRMNLDEVDDYITSINKLKKDNDDISILSGFEAEYDPAKIGFLCEMRDKVDYMILGQHYLKDGINEIKKDNSENYPIEYAKYVCEAIDSGLFDIVAHPDIFFEQYETIKDDKRRQIFLDNSVVASKMICEHAKEMGIPIELNLSGALRDKAYPNRGFWKIASDSGVKTIVGADAHTPDQLVTMAIDYDIALDKIGDVELNKVDYDYNPVHERKKNTKLNMALDETRKNSYKYDAYLVTQLVSKMLNSKIDIKDINKRGIEAANEIRKMANKEDPALIIERINNDNSVNLDEKKRRLNKTKEVVLSPQYMKVFDKRQKTLKKSATLVEKAVKDGCKSNEEIVTYVRKGMRDDKFKVLDDFMDNSNSREKEKPKVLVKTNNNDGYLLTMSISLIPIIISIMVSLVILFYILN